MAESSNGKQLKYFQLMEDLKEQIISGKIKAGEKLPSENELSQNYQVSRQTSESTGYITECRIYLCRTWERDILFRTAAAYT